MILYTGNTWLPYRGVFKWYPNHRQRQQEAEMSKYIKRIIGSLNLMKAGRDRNRNSRRIPISYQTRTV